MFHTDRLETRGGPRTPAWRSAVSLPILVMAPSLLFATGWRLI